MSGGKTVGIYAVAAARARAEIEIKKSRFIAWAVPADTREQAMAVLAEARAEYPDARHHCWAYLLGPGHSPAGQAFSDDGEPGGTAGKPILNVLNHKAIGNLMLVVIRYFGGVKLGAGGLVRAYSQAAQAVMDCLPVAQVEPKVTCELLADYAAEQWLRYWLGQHQGDMMDVHYAGQVRYRLQLPHAAVAELTAQAAAQGWQLSMNSDKETR